MIGLLFLAIILPSLPCADTLLMFDAGEGPQKKEFQYVSDNKGFSIKASPHGGFFGQSCLVYSTGKAPGPYMMRCRLPLLKSFWLSFAFHADSLSTIKEAGYTTPIELAGLSFFEPRQPGEPRSVIDICIVPHPGHRSDIRLTLRPSNDPGLRTVFHFPVATDRTHLVELHTEFTPDGKVALGLYLDGRRSLATDAGYFLPLQFLSLGASNSFRGDFHVRIRVDGMTVTRDRAYCPPLASHRGITRVRRTSVLLRPGYPASLLPAERISQVEWRLFRETESAFPIYQTRTSERYLFDSLKFPFALDSGAYGWQIQRKNHFNRWSDWGPRYTFRAGAFKRSAMKVRRVTLSQKPFGPPLSELKKEHWYRLNFELSPDSALYRTGNLIAFLSSPDYPYGNPSNQGGAFLPAANYPANFSLDPQPGFRTQLFEKNENSVVSIELPGTRHGRYLDKREAVLDTAKGRVSFRFKLLRPAVEGPWMLTAYVRSIADTLSNIVRVPVTVVSAGTGGPQPWTVGFLSVFFLVALGVAARLRRRAAVSPPEMPLPNPKKGPS